MSHCDEDALSLIALGESPSAEDESHLASCARCQSRVDQLSAVVAEARQITDSDRPAAPPASVWAAIQSELALPADADVIPIAAGRRARAPRTWLIVAAAAAVGVVFGGVATGLITADRNSPQVMATATLDPIDDSTAVGTATVEHTDSGDVLTVDVSVLPAGDGYYEVWMATPDTTTMVAMGALVPGTAAHFALPPGLDPAQFPVVDVSLEHFDGDAGHSATSVARGQLVEQV